MKCEICGNNNALMRFPDGTCGKCRGSVADIPPGGKLCRITATATGRSRVYPSITHAARAMQVTVQCIRAWTRGLPSRDGAYTAELIGWE